MLREYPSSSTISRTRIPLSIYAIQSRTMERYLIRLRTFGQVPSYLVTVFDIRLRVGPLLLGFSSDRWRSYRPMLEALDLSFLIAGAIFRASGNTVFQRTNKWQMSVREELLLTFQPDIKRML